MNLRKLAPYACVIVAALGYFVDTYDLLLISVLRTPSLTELGLSGDALVSEGVFLLNCQMVGTLIGGILFGILGDKRGRVSVLFISILLYSGATLLNSFVQNVEQYAILRFIAGIGLAGELGVGVTLVNETLPQRIRGYGVTIVATIGVSGVVVAAFVGQMFHWRTSYLIGGVLGLLLLALRVLVKESGMYEMVAKEEVARGDLRLLVQSKERFFRFLNCILIGVPIWYVVGILITFAPGLGKSLGMVELPTAGTALIYCYSGLVVGDCASGLLSQILKSRKLPILLFILVICGGMAAYFTNQHPTLSQFYWTCAALGFGSGYWALFVTTASEQFGTNLRATVTTSTPNFVRGTVVPVTFGFKYLMPLVGILNAALYVGIGCVLLALLSYWALKESFHNDLNFVER